MTTNRFDKVYKVLRAEFPAGESVSLAVNLSEAKGDSLIVFQELEETLTTDNTRQTRTIGVRLIAAAKKTSVSNAIMSRAVNALEAAPNIRVFDRSGAAVDVDALGPAPSGVMLTSQRVDLR